MNVRIPIIAAHVDCSLRNLTEILLAGGARDHEIVYDGYVWSQHAAAQVKKGLIRAMRYSRGSVVCYHRVKKRVRPHHVDPARSWQKTPSGPVHTMQLVEGRKGRMVPVDQRSVLA